MVIHTRPSTWIAVATVVLCAFVALPAQHNYEIFGIIVALQIALIWQARHEGRQSK